MKWAAVRLAALCALCVPTALQAQDEGFTASVVRDALSGFAADFYSSSCFGPNRPPLPLRVAVAQMEPSTKFRDDEEQTITERVEGALAADPRWFQVRPRRLRFELDEIRKALGESKSLAPTDQLDGIIAISPEGGRTVDVVAYAYSNSRECVGAIRSVAVGRISKSADVPDKLFQRAARRLPDKGMERLIVMPPDLTGFADGLPAQVMARQLQGQLLNAINQVFQSKAERSPAGDTPRSPAQRYVDGLDVSGAWQAFLHLSRSQGIDVVVEFRGPGDQPGTAGISDSGYFAANDVLPADSDPAVIAEADAICSSVRQAIDTQTDPDALQALDQQNQCPRLHDEILKKEARQRESICNEDRARWSNAEKLSLREMEAVAATMRCRQMLDEARRDIGERRDREAAIERVKSAAADLGTLTDGRTVTAKRAGGDAVTGVLKFQMIEAGSVQIQVDDPAGNLDVALRDSSWQVIARARGGAAVGKEIETRLEPATYYIEATPADRKHSEAYTLRVAKGFVDTAGATPATARDLGSLEPGALTIGEHVGGADKGDVFRFTVRERMLLKLTAGGLTSDVRIDLLDQSAQVVRSASYRPGRPQTVESVVEPGSAYYIAVMPAGQATSYSLAIALSQMAAYSRPEIAAPAAIGASPLTSTLATADTAYYARFTLRESSRLSIDLTWQGQTAHDLNLFKEDGGLRPLPGSVTRGTASRSISADFAPGTYIVKVTRASGSSPAMPFTLALRALTLYPSKDKAADLEIGASPVPSTLPAEGDNYWAKFRVSRGARVQIVLSDPQNALRLFLENDRGPLPVWSRNGTIDSTLPPGVYWIHVSRAGSSGPVPFQLSLQRVAF